MITKTIPISMRIVISYAMKWGSYISLWRYLLFSFHMETETTTWSEFPNEGKAIVVEQILVSEKINKSKRAGITVWKVNHQSKVIWDRKFITEFTRSISSTRVGKPVLMMDVKVSKDKNSRWVDQENLIYVRWNRIKNCTKTKKMVIDRGKRST